MFKKLIFLLLLASTSLFAQSGLVSDVALQNKSGYAQIPAGTAIYVCAYNSNLTCVTPSSEIPIYSDVSLAPSSQIAQPIIVDANGRYSYYIPSNTQAIQKSCYTANQCINYVVFVGGSGENITFGSGPPSGSCTEGSIYYDSSASYAQYVCGSDSSWHPSGGGGGGSLPSATNPPQIPYLPTLGSSTPSLGALDSGLFPDPTGTLETTVTLNAGQGGAIDMGDSNSGGTGLPTGLSWGQTVCQAMNRQPSQCATSPYNSISTNVAGDRSSDNSNRAYAGFAPSDNYNPIVWNQYNTNNLNSETSATPIPAHKLAFVSQTRAAFVHIGTSMTDKYLPTAQPATQTGQNVSLAANQAVATVNNNFFPHQRLLMSGCTQLTNLGYVELTKATATTITFPYANSNVVQAISGETCSFTPSNPWTLSGSWQATEVLGTANIASGSSQGIFYRTGNLLTISCTVKNAVFQVGGSVPVSATPFNVTITTSGGVVTSVTLNNPGDQGILGGQYLQIAGGNGDAIVQVVNVTGQYQTLSVNLINGGTGYSNSSSVSLNQNGGLLLPLTTVQIGIGCPTNTAATLPITCSNGTASSCGQLGTLGYVTNPLIEQTFGVSDAMTLSSVYVGSGGDVDVIYPAGPGFGGTWQITADGGSPLTDTVSGTSTISTSFGPADGYRYGPANFGGSSALQAAHFKVTAFQNHNFVITATNTGGSSVAIAELAIPMASHLAGVNPPNIIAGGAIPGGSNSAPQCGLGVPAGCQPVYSGWLSGLVNEMHKEGYVVKYYDNQNVDPNLGYALVSGTSSTLVNNVIANYTNPLHMSSDGHRVVAGNALAAAGASPATPQFVNALQGTQYNHHDSDGKTSTDGFLVYDYFGNQFTGIPTYNNYSSQGMIRLNPQGYGNYFCQTLNPSTTTLIPPFSAGYPTPDCGFEFTTNPDSNTGPLVLHAISQQLTTTQTASSHQLELSGTTANLGVYQVSQPQGSGYSGTPVLSFVSNGACSTYPTANIRNSSGAIIIILLTTGTCTTIPTYNVTGISAGSGFNWTLALGGSLSIASQSPGSGYSGSGAVTATGGQCPTAPTFNSSLSGGGIVISVATAGNCYVAPTGVSVAGYTGGSGFTATFSLPTQVNDLARWQIYANGNQMTFRERNLNTGPSVPSISFQDFSGGGFRINMGSNNNAQVGYIYTLDQPQMTANITGVPMTTLTTTGTSGPATYTPGTGVLNIPNYAGGGTGFPITIGSTPIAASSTTTTIAGLTLNSPTFVTPALGTPASGILTNATGLPAASVVSGALANGMTATTQTVGDNTNKLATDAFVLANVGIGTVTHTGSLTSLQVLVGNGSADIKADTGCSTDGAGTQTCVGYNTSGPTNGYYSLTSIGTPAPSASANSVLLTVPNSVTAYTFTFPGAPPASNGYILSSTTAGLTSWIPAAGTGTVNTGTINQFAYYASAGTAVSGLSLTGYVKGNGASIPTASATVPISDLSGTFSAHQFFGNNTGSSGTPVASLIGTSDFTPNAYVASTGSVNALVATYTPAVTALVAGLEINVLPNLANTTTTPTINVNGLGAKTITKNGTSVLAAGDLSTTAVASLIYDGTQFQLQNPQTVSGGAGVCEEVISSSTTPAFTAACATSKSVTTLTASVTSYTIASGSAGYSKTVCFVENSTGSFTVSGTPSNIKGTFFGSMNTTANRTNCQHFVWDSASTQWWADSAGASF